MDELAGFDVSIQSVALAMFGVAAVFMIFRGLLVPKSVVERLLKAKDEVIASQAETIAAHNSNAEMQEKLLSALNTAAGEKVGSDGT